MADRFAELINKQLAGKLNAKEQKELTRLLYQGQLPPHEPEPRFVSKHRMKQTDVAARIKAIEWFAHCGEPCEFDLTTEVERVRSWPNAIKGMKTPDWENAILEARNQLSMFLGEHHEDRFQKWNEITHRFKNEVTTPLSENVLHAFRKKHGLDEELVHSTRWNILAALMENAYLDCNHGCFFFLELLTVYEAGHLPCGWRGEWPAGKLVVF